MPNEVLSAALAEAYRFAPTDTIIFDTLEFRHTKFIDDDGNPTAIRVVRDNQDLWAYLEANAPIDAGMRVRFIAYWFEILLPRVDDKAAPEISISIDNVGLEIINNIARSVESQEQIKVTYRPYLSTDKTRPHYDPPLHLTLTDISVDLQKIQGKARFGDLANRLFPGETYSQSRFKGLSR